MSRDHVAGSKDRSPHGDGIGRCASQVSAGPAAPARSRPADSRAGSQNPSTLQRRAANRFARRKTLQGATGMLRCNRRVFWVYWS